LIGVIKLYFYSIIFFMKHILIYTLQADSALIMHNLSDHYELVLCTTFDEAMESIQIKVPHLIICDYEALHNGNSAFHNALNNNFILIDIPVIAISCLSDGSAGSLSMKQKLYMFNIKRYLYIHAENIKFQQTVENELNKWNPNLGSYTHRFVKSFLLFAGSKKYEQSMRIHLNYILSHFPQFSNIVMSDIKFASAILSTTFTTQNYHSIVEFYTNMRFARPILKLLKNVYLPTTLEEEIVSSVFRLERHLNHSAPNLSLLPSMDGIRPEVVQYLLEAYVEKRCFLQSYKDIIPFWEDISNLLLKNPLFTDKEISVYLEMIQECLLLCIMESYNAYLQIINETQKFTVKVMPKDLNNGTMRRWAELNDMKCTNIVVHWMDEEGGALTLMLEKANQLPPNVEIPAVVSNHIHEVHSLPHYSASEYIQDLGGINTIAEELHLLDDAMIDIFTLLDEKSDLANETTRINIIKCIHEYRDILQNSFYEFQAIALTLFKLENLLQGLVEDTDIDLIKFRRILLMIFDDLAEWKATVFERQAALDINYLDSSILSSSYQIEALFLPHQDNEEDELELF